MTRGKLLDRIKVELAGGIAVRVAIGEDTNFGLPGTRQVWDFTLIWSGQTPQPSSPSALSMPDA